jgi:hypothetical protein
MTYTLEFTPLAAEIANLHGGVPALEDQIRKELAPPWGPEDINKLAFHCCAFGGSHFDDSIPNFIVKPTRKDVLLVDSAGPALEMDEPLPEGRFKGYRVKFLPEAFD